nr:hypothetical protein [Ochrobactrum sp. LM19]
MLLLTMSFHANASSSDAWQQLYNKAERTCITQSRLVSPFVSEPVVFDDSIGKVAILLREGSSRNKTFRKNTTFICLFDKKTNKTAIEEYRWKK